MVNAVHRQCTAGTSYPNHPAKDRTKGHIEGRSATQIEKGTATWLKIAIGAGAVALTSFLFPRIGMGVAATPSSKDPSKPYVFDPKPLKALTDLPPRIGFLSRHMHAGYQFTDYGHTACVSLSDDIYSMKTASQCTADATKLISQIVAQGSLKTLQITREQAMEKGKGVYVNDDNFFMVGIDPSNVINFSKALMKAEAEMVAKPDFFQRPVDDIIAVFKQIHRLLTKGVPEAFPGRYRKTCPMIFNTPVLLKGMSADESRMSQLREKGFDQLDIDLSIYAMSQVENSCDFPDWVKDMWGSIAGRTCPPKEIPDRLHNLIEKLQKMAADKEDPITMAATAHGELVRIHPWQDRNGRFARIIMNTILAMYEQKQVIFPTKQAYFEAIESDNERPGAFEDYLRNVIAPWNKHAQLILA